MNNLKTQSEFKFSFSTEWLRFHSNGVITIYDFILDEERNISPADVLAKIEKNFSYIGDNSSAMKCFEMLQEAGHFRNSSLIQLMLTYMPLKNRLLISAEKEN